MTPAQRALVRARHTLAASTESLRRWRLRREGRFDETSVTAEIAEARRVLRNVVRNLQAIR